MYRNLHKTDPDNSGFKKRWGKKKQKHNAVRENAGVDGLFVTATKMSGLLWFNYKQHSKGQACTTIDRDSQQW